MCIYSDLVIIENLYFTR